MREIHAALAIIFLGCGGGEVTPDGATPTAAITPTATALFQPGDEVEDVAGGPVSGRWCGRYSVLGDVEIPAGEILELCPTAVVAFEEGASLTVSGTLRATPVEGEGPAVLSADDLWGGIRVDGAVEGALRIERATLCLDGTQGSRIDLTDSTLEGCQAGIRLAAGGTFTRTRILGGSTVYVSGGILSMSDSTLDLGHPTRSPDCTSVSGGGLILDHVRFTGCHCPIHINRADATVSVSASIFDGAAVPMMIARTSGATFSGSHFLGTGPGIQDIGGSSGEIQAHVAGNYWGGDAPDIDTGDPSQFTGADTWLDAPIDGVGPR